MDGTIGERIQMSLRGQITQRALAEVVGMPEDAMSRAIRGQRGFAALEAAAIARHLRIDAHWLITGQRDPLRVTPAAARHFWNRDSLTHVNPGKESDSDVLEHLASAYGEAYPDGPPPSRVPVQASPDVIRDALGDGFLSAFDERVEEAFDVDVVRRPDVSTDYSYWVGDRAVIVLSTTPKWFRSNWSLAHELGHLVLRHSADLSAKEQETQANAFAAELLLPASDIAAIDWLQADRSAIARFLWERGVSNEALVNRFSALGISHPPAVSDYLANWSTKAIVREVADHADVVKRELNAARPRPATSLAAVLERRVEGGDASPMALAWLLDVPVDDLDWPEPDEDAVFEKHQEVVAGRPSALNLLG